MKMIHTILLVVLLVIGLSDFADIQAQNLPSHDKQDQNSLNMAAVEKNVIAKLPTISTPTTYIPPFMTLKPTTSTKKNKRKTTEQPQNKTTEQPQTTKKEEEEEKEEKKEKNQQNENKQEEMHEEAQGEESIPTEPVNPAIVTAASVGGVAAAGVVGVVVVKKLKKKPVDPKCVYLYDKDTEGHTHDDRYKPTAESEASTSESAPLLPSP